MWVLLLDIQPNTDPKAFIEELKAPTWALSNPERKSHCKWE
jgi:hypothetical protein